MTARGALVLVGTPIGNLGDLSSRARQELEGADVIACEDTRRTGKLFELAGITRSAPFVVVNDHTEARRTDELLDRIRGDARVVLVSDAGMPGLSDPGQVLVAAAIAADLPVEVIPGPSAAISALVSSGFATGRFTTPEEVATLVVMLASERTANVTGANFVIDGGLIKTM